ncbi:MAG: FHA domain-containing protein [Sandaracinaceae bacterium]|nr:FHA domain-containing protein [Sandaracinaceae bacterium]
MEEDLGIACGACDTFSPMGANWCPICGHDLALFPTPAAPAAAAEQEDEMEQSRYYVCKECSTPVPSGHKFCGACGATVPKEMLEKKVEFFGSMQAPGKARLILISGTEGADGLSYLLQGTEHVVGTTDAQIPFPTDPWVSPRHANFFYRNEKLVVRDEKSLNGVFVRVKQPTAIAPGTKFLCGKQVFRLEATPKDTSGPDPDQTYFYSSPKRPSPFRVVQILEGGADGMVYCARENSVQIGREGSDMNFPEDVFMSGTHAKVELAANGAFSLVDLGSRNGTYVRIDGERELGHGDYLFVGHQLLRVEQTT